MPESKEPKPNLPLIGIVLLAATVGGVYFYGKPFESLRPRERAIETSSTLGPQFVPTRLWEDPFTAVFKRVEQRPDQKGLMGMFQYAPNHSAEHLKKQIKKHAGKHGKVTIMPVMVFGGPYAEQIEGRRRKRYAVLSALAVSGYSPVDSEHIDYLQIPWAPRRLTSDQRIDGTSQCPFNQSSSGPHTSTGCLIIPYEWVVPSDKKIRPLDSNSEQHGPVLVLWLDDGLFEDQPLSRLEQLIRQVIEEAPANNVSIKIIGPAGSTTLREMVQEACERPSSRPPWLKHRIEIYSPNATVPDTLLIPESDTKTLHQGRSPTNDATRCKKKPEPDARGTISEAFKYLGMTLYRTIPTDYDLARYLKEELVRRRVEMKPLKTHIVLIAEWDTFYGRSLPATFLEVITGRDEKNMTWKTDCKKYGVCRYSYMRGLDGEAPNEEKEAAKTGKEGGAGKKDSQTLERAIGDSQFDYLRRLGSHIEQDMEDEGGKVQAIGVLGSDVYDKLLILQALHDRFPTALFFTTDLDARYVHRAESKWTRNLIVGSGFGLELHSDRQGKIPPFRDSYQTAVFYAVQGALKGNLSTRPLTPRLFEIGRRQPIDLSVDQDPVHPERQDSPVPDIKTIVILFVLAFLLLWVIVRPRTGFLVGSGIVIVAPVVLIIWLVTSQEPLKGEPFDLWEGISLWPTEAIRLYALLLAWGFIVQGALSLRNSNKILSDQYDLSIKADTPLSRADIVSGVSRHRLRIWVSQWLSPWPMIPDGEKSDEVAVQQLWARYRESGGGLPIFVRVLITSVVYWICVRSLFVIIRGDNFTLELITRIFLTASGRFAPGRGGVSFCSNRVILILAVFSLIGLIFFTVDATRLCRQFIKRLGHKQLQWPSQTIRKFAEERGMGAHSDDLSEWLALQLIAQRTRVVGNLIYYPFIVLLLMIMARSHLFDRWILPWPLVLVFGLNAAWVIGCAVALRNRAEKSRRWALDRLNQKLLQALGGEAARIERIRLLIQEVKDNREGAFCPLSEQPVIRTILLFLGGSGSLIFLEYFIQSR